MVGSNQIDERGTKYDRMANFFNNNKICFEGNILVNNASKGFGQNVKLSIAGSFEFILRRLKKMMRNETGFDTVEISTSIEQCNSVQLETVRELESDLDQISPRGDFFEKAKEIIWCVLNQLLDFI